MLLRPGTEFFNEIGRILKFPAGSDLFERLECARKGSAIRLPRNTWILQAIAEKLVRDSS